MSSQMFYSASSAGAYYAAKDALDGMLESLCHELMIFDIDTTS